jgi:lycopene beta-cyclase
LEPRTSYRNDRTWCFWDLDSHPFRDLITHRWFQWQVSSGGKSVHQCSENAAYAMLPADVLYRFALARIEATPAFDLNLGVTVESVKETMDGAIVSASNGVSRAKAVIDTRPPDGDQLVHSAGCWQVFSGLEIICPNHGFETSTARLMDFQPDYPHPCFVYFLPLDDERLLVEWTAFQAEKKGVSDYRSDLESWLQAKGLGHYEIVRSESGALPMMPVVSSSDSGHIIRAGVGAGWMRAATGYHFVSCQRGSEKLARSILEAHACNDWKLQAPSVRPGWLNWMDRVFLRAMKKHPDKAPRWFLELFANTSPEQMARFMNDQPRLRDAFKIACSLPPGPFLRGALPW